MVTEQVQCKQSIYIYMCIHDDLRQNMGLKKEKLKMISYSAVKCVKGQKRTKMTMPVGVKSSSQHILVCDG